MNYELIYASDFEEFYYVEDDFPVSEGNPVGFEMTVEDRGDPDNPPSTRVEFKVFNHVYWKPNFESLD